MKWHILVATLTSVALLTGVLAIPSAVSAGERTGVVSGMGKYNPDDPTVEIFAGMAAGQLEVHVIARDSTQCRIVVKNKTDKPLNVRLPDLLAAAPVLAQFPDPFNQNNNNNNQNNNRNGAPQQLMMGNPFMDNQQGNNQPGNNRQQGNNRQPMFGFNVTPEKEGRFKMTAACLEHGKGNPRPAHPYELKRLETVTAKAEVHELCRMLGSGEIGQRTTQVAAWHLNNDMSWDELRDLRGEIAFGRITKPYFTRNELAAGKEAVETITERLKQPEGEEGKGPMTKGQ